MAADATLVNAAFREGRTRAAGDVPSMKPMFESQKKVQKTYMDTITSVMKTIQEGEDAEELAKATQLKPIKETIQKAYNALENGEPLPQFVVDDFTRQIEDLQDQFEKVNTEGKGDTRANEQERRRITARLMRLKNQAINVRAKYMIAFQDPNSYNDPLIKKENLDPVNSIAKAFSDPDAAAEMFKNGNIRGEFVDGEYTIHTKNYSTGQVRGHVERLGINFEGINATDTYDPAAESAPATDEVIEEYKYGDEKSYTASSLAKALPYKNLETDTRIKDWRGGEKALGTNDGANDVVNKYIIEDGTSNVDAVQAEVDEFYNNIIPTDEDYYDAQARRFGGTPSFKQALGGLVGIPVDVLNNMFLDEFGNPVGDMATQLDELKDVNNDGVIDSKDAPKDKTALDKFMNNIKLAKEEILKNRELGGPMMADYYTKSKIKVYTDNYNAAVKKRTKTGKTTDSWWKQMGFKNIDEGISSDWCKNNPWCSETYKNQIESKGSHPSLGKMLMSDVFEGGSGASFYGERFDQLEGLGQDIALKEDMPVNVGGKKATIKWSDDDGAYITEFEDGTVNNIFKNKRELIETLFLKEDEELGSTYLGSDAYTKIPDWNYEKKATEEEIESKFKKLTFPGSNKKLITTLTDDEFFAGYTFKQHENQKKAITISNGKKSKKIWPQTKNWKINIQKFMNENPPGLK